MNNKNCFKPRKQQKFSLILCIEVKLQITSRTDIRKWKLQFKPGNTDTKHHAMKISQAIHLNLSIVKPSVCSLLAYENVNEIKQDSCKTQFSLIITNRRARRCETTLVAVLNRILKFAWRWFLFCWEYGLFSLNEENYTFYLFSIFRQLCPCYYFFSNLNKSSFIKSLISIYIFKSRRLLPISRQKKNLKECEIIEQYK